MSAEGLKYDVVVVGAGPSGLSAAIHIKQLAKASNKEISVCILEKGAQVSSQIISGAVLDPISLKELLPNEWKEAPLNTPVITDSFYYLTQSKAHKLPTPAPLENQGHYIISLGELCRFLADKAEALGCEIYPGFSASKVLYNEDEKVIGVETGPMGLDKEGNKTPQYQPGIQIHAHYTLLAEGCRGQLSEQIIHMYDLRRHCDPQTYGLGIKEVWKLNRTIEPGQVIHTIGWPLDNKTYGGSFLYTLKDNKVSIGFVVGLDYQNPWLSPFEELQRFKTHPFIRTFLEGGERIGYGARAINEGGLQSLPKLTFPGGALIGDAAGFLNVAKIKGIHTAIKSGMLAAQGCVDNIIHLGHHITEITTYPEYFKKSWLYDELYKVRNIRPGFQRGLWLGLANAAFEVYVSKGKSPWTFHNHNDYTQLKKANTTPCIIYPKPDGKLTFDRASSVYLTNTTHDDNQPVHIKLKKPKLAIEVNYNLYESPETRYCPAAVFEIIHTDSTHLLIHGQNCIQCKTCDIKDPKQNIVWTAPQGGSGPNYMGM